MDELSKQAAEVAAEVARRQESQKQHLANAVAHETEARNERRLASEDKAAAAAGLTVLGTLQVRQRIVTDEAAAKAARAEAEKVLAESKAKSAELDVILAGAKAAAEQATAAAEAVAKATAPAPVAEPPAEKK